MENWTIKNRMRTIAEIKNEIGNKYIADENVRRRYGIAEGEAYENVFSVVSIENILFYCCAFGIWLLENILDSHKKEVQADLDSRQPHTAQWYRNQVLNFEYNGGKPIAYCAVNDYDNKLQIKIASGSAGNRNVVDSASAAALASWLQQNKDAGLKVSIINENRDKLAIKVVVYYDSLYLQPGEKKVDNAIKEYVSNLEFDGLLTAHNLNNAILAVPGVKLVDVVSCKVQYAENAPIDLGVQRMAISGYWTVKDEDVEVIYTPYTNSNIADYEY